MGTVDLILLVLAVLSVIVLIFFVCELYRGAINKKTARIAQLEKALAEKSANENRFCQEGLDTENQEMENEPETAEDVFVKKILAGEKIPAGTVVDHDVDLSSEKIFKDLILEDIIFEGSLTLEDAEITGVVSLKNSKIKGDLVLNNASADKFDLMGIVVEGECSASCDAKIVDFSNSILGDDFIIENSNFKGDLICQGMRLQGNFRSQETSFEGLLDLSEAKIKGWLDLSGTQIANLRAHKIEIEGECDLDEITVNGETFFDGASFGGEVKIKEAQINGLADFSGATIKEAFCSESTTYENGINLSKVKASSYIDLERVTTAFLDIRDININGSCHLGGIDILGEFLFNGAVIEEDLEIQGATIKLIPGLTVKGSIKTEA